MHVRAAMQVAASRAQAASARTLLQQVRRPLTTLNTFGSMLVPRLKEGDADRDMAKGIMLQVRNASCCATLTPQWPSGVHDIKVFGWCTRPSRLHQQPDVALGLA